METDTIAAISTALGEGAIGIVRLSGPQAVHYVNRLFKGKDLESVPSHTIHYGHIVEIESNEHIDEVMVSVMRAPKTYTREDIVEVNCHGGVVAVRRVLSAVLQEGARLAEPGEFTKRAFLHGRVDLSQAEAVMDVIRSKTDEAMKVASHQMEGRLSRLIRQLRQTLIETVAHVEVNIDYPEYDDVEEMSEEMMRVKTKEVHQEIEHLLHVAKQGKILREGIRTGIIGRPNVGKSSLLNAIVQENKAIVTDVPGTTRDIIEEYVQVRGVPLRLVDTAGIRETEDIVEKIGVEQSRKVLGESDLILLVLNNNEPLTVEDEHLFEAVQGVEVIVLINKTDLPNELDMERVRKLAGDFPIIPTAFIEEKGIEALEEAIQQAFFAGDITSGDLTYVSNIRHIRLLEEAKDALEEAMHGLELHMPMDIVQIDVTRTWELLGEIIGDTASDSLIDQLFSQFCLGK